ncbi:MAG TPA: Rieske (2Fe-2S) protein [Oculatellaceae cyanobacterium]
MKYTARNNEGITRASFLQMGIAGLGCLWTGMTAYPIYRYLTPKLTDDSDTKVETVTVGAASSVAVNSGKNFKFGSSPALITHTPDGKWHAFKATCTHLGCTVQYSSEKSQIVCACHGGCYDASTGRNIAGPPPKPLTGLKIEIIEDKIVVSKA